MIKRITNEKQREQIKQKKAEKAVLLDLPALLEAIEKRLKKLENKK